MLSRPLILAAVLPLLAVSTQTSHAAFTPTITVSNVRVSHDLYLAHSEPDIVENPANPQNLVAGSKMFIDPAHYQFYIGTYYSKNGGRTWTDTQLLPGYKERGFVRTSDISFAFSPDGKFVYACVLAHGLNDIPSGIYISRSSNGGKTWSSPVTVFEDDTGATFSDKPWIAVDWSRRASRGTVYVVWNLDATGASAHDPDTGNAVHPRLAARQVSSATDQPGIVIARSTDRGQTFSAPFVVRPFDRQNNHFALGAIPAVGPDGHVYVAYLAYDDIKVNGRTETVNRMDVAVSTDRGKTWTERVAVDRVSNLPDRLPNSTFRNYSMPAFAVSPADGSMVLAWADMRNGDADILSSQSSDGGKTWSAPYRVNHDHLQNKKDQFQPALAVAPNGTYTCAWFDRRYDPSNRLIDEVIAQSTDHGKTFGHNIRVTAKSWDPAIDAPVPEGTTDTFIGDYQGVAADNTTVHPLWNDTQNGTSQEIRTAVVSTSVFTRH